MQFSSTQSVRTVKKNTSFVCTLVSTVHKKMLNEEELRRVTSMNIFVYFTLFQVLCLLLRLLYFFF